uniref:F-box domain-containing protein n=1 Tax=Chromera velia CCMP2878 TaxID=1169474 RepID=A0A0G4H6W5_9ALVE|eukprot:Cvel_24946.t1-p1 / transcript=Cvel_24946.t1 / gene=Cvel_24946 / organism=Chromera_velia_CCMP2878 / gene_product=hypothetical protein / transcript_product=hypothetical protein / location=Cvel_scaffold2761:5225-11052(+) / protein_length=1077 / sequence_SO=supercontig / SO=protein_coding / is_pseudo=false
MGLLELPDRVLWSLVGFLEGVSATGGSVLSLCLLSKEWAVRLRGADEVWLRLCVLGYAGKTAQAQKVSGNIQHAQRAQQSQKQEGALLDSHSLVATGWERERAEDKNFPSGSEDCEERRGRKSETPVTSEWYWRFLEWSAAASAVRAGKARSSREDLRPLLIAAGLSNHEILRIVVLDDRADSCVFALCHDRATVSFWIVSSPSLFSPFSMNINSSSSSQQGKGGRGRYQCLCVISPSGWSSGGQRLLGGEDLWDPRLRLSDPLPCRSPLKSHQGPNMVFPLRLSFPREGFPSAAEDIEDVVHDGISLVCICTGVHPIFLTIRSFSRPWEWNFACVRTSGVLHWSFHCPVGGPVLCIPRVGPSHGRDHETQASPEEKGNGLRESRHRVCRVAFRPDGVPSASASSERLGGTSDLDIRGVLAFADAGGRVCVSSYHMHLQSGGGDSFAPVVHTQPLLEISLRESPLSLSLSHTAGESSDVPRGSPGIPFWVHPVLPLVVLADARGRRLMVFTFREGGKEREWGGEGRKRAEVRKAIERRIAEWESVGGGSFSGAPILSIVGWSPAVGLRQREPELGGAPAGSSVIPTLVECTVGAQGAGASFLCGHIRVIVFMGGLFVSSGRSRREGFSASHDGEMVQAVDVDEVLESIWAPGEGGCGVSICEDEMSEIIVGGSTQGTEVEVSCPVVAPSRRPERRRRGGGVRDPFCLLWRAAPQSCDSVQALRWSPAARALFLFMRRSHRLSRSRHRPSGCLQIRTVRILGIEEGKDASAVAVSACVARQEEGRDGGGGLHGTGRGGSSRRRGSLAAHLCGCLEPSGVCRVARYVLSVLRQCFGSSSSAAATAPQWTFFFLPLWGEGTGRGRGVGRAEGGSEGEGLLGDERGASVSGFRDTRDLIEGDECVEEALAERAGGNSVFSPPGPLEGRQRGASAAPYPSPSSGCDDKADLDAQRVSGALREVAAEAGEEWTCVEERGLQEAGGVLRLFGKSDWHGGLVALGCVSSRLLWVDARAQRLALRTSSGGASVSGRGGVSGALTVGQAAAAMQAVVREVELVCAEPACMNLVHASVRSAQESEARQ